MAARAVSALVLGSLVSDFQFPVAVQGGVFEPTGCLTPKSRTNQAQLPPDSWTATDYFASSFKSLSSGLEDELPVRILH